MINRLFELPAPSSFSDPRIWKSLQIGSSGAIILNHCPSEASGIPVTLCHPVFVHFQDLCLQTEISQEDCELVLQLTSEMSVPFKDENERRESFTKIIENYLDQSFDCPTMGVRGIVSDGFIMLQKDLIWVILAILEVKPELG